jgi:peroxiredoxin
MKKYILAGAATLCVAGMTVHAQNTGGKFTLSGALTGTARDSVALSYRSADGKFLHLAQAVKGGRFSFDGYLEGPESAQLLFKSKGVKEDATLWQQAQHFYIEPGVMTIQLDPDKPATLRMTGSKTQEDQLAYDALLKPLHEVYETLSIETKKETDPEKQKELRKKRQAMFDAMNDKTYEFFIAHPASYFTEDKLQMFSMLFNQDSSRRVFDALPAEMKQNRIGRTMGARFMAMESVADGKMVKAFKTIDVNSQPLSTDQFKGKYLILDFWASWCVPCRHSHPALRRIYAQYHSKGLEIVGIANDGPRPAVWRQAIAQDSIGVWRHILDGSDAQKTMNGIANPDDIMALYGVTALPTKFLIDRQGRIIMRETGSDMTAMADKIEALFMAEADSAQTVFIREHPDAPASLKVLRSIAGPVPDLEKILPLFNSLSPAVRESEAGRQFGANLEKLRTTAIGAMAPEFEQADTAGHIVQLSSFRRRYVLIDFWASWCHPCRAENPNLVKDYAVYHPRGLEVWGVSLDKPGQKEAWIKAIQEDKLTWTQTTDLLSWKSPVAGLYNIGAIPQNFLVNPEGKIIATNLRGEALSRKLAEIFGKM